MNAPGRRWFQFSLKSLFLLTLGVAVFFHGYSLATRRPPALTGKVIVDGSSTVYPISEATASEFRKRHPTVELKVRESGTAGGFKRFAKDETDISDASRPITSDEFAECQRRGINFIEIPVAYEAISIVVHKGNDWIKELTLGQIQAIFLADKAAKKWKEVDARWPNEDIKIYGPASCTGQFDYFKEVVGGKKKKTIRGDMFGSEDDNVLVTGVNGDKHAIGFYGCAYYFANKDKLRVVPIVNSALKKAIEPTPNTIADGEYAPFSRPLFIYVKEGSLKRPQVRAFVEYYLDNAAAVATKVGFVPLPESLYNLAKNHYQQKLAGTCFLTEDGSERSGALVEVFKKENLAKVK